MAYGRLQGFARHRPRSPTYSQYAGSLRPRLARLSRVIDRAKPSAGRQRRPVAVAITGGIGAGKSEASRAFARHGAAVISSDEIVHDLLRTDPEVKAAISARWPQVVGADGEIDRERVSDVVFTDPAQLVWLERLLHPRVVSTYLRWRRDLGRLPDPPAVCVTEVPLLYEVGGESRFDAVVVVTAAPEVRVSRLVRPVQDRERRLIPDEEKMKRADFAYVNDGTLDDLDAFVSDVMGKLTGP